MDTEEKQEVTVHVWPFSTVCWFGMAGVATLLEIQTLVQRTSQLFTKPLTSHPSPNVPGPPHELIDLSFRFGALLLMLLFGVLPLLIILVAVWRRWANVGIRQTNYWVWTSIQGSVAALIFIPVFLKAFVFYTAELASCIPSLIWIFHTFAKPYKSGIRTEASPPPIEKP